MSVSSLLAGAAAPAASSVVWFFILRAAVRRAYRRGHTEARSQCADELRAWSRRAGPHAQGLAVDVLGRNGEIIHMTAQ